MKRISIVNTYYREDFKEKLFNFTLMDEHSIFCTSSNIANVDIPLDSIFYTNAEDKEKKSFGNAYRLKDKSLFNISNIYPFKYWINF